MVHSLSNIRVPNTRVAFGSVLNAYVVMTSSLLHNDTENFEKNKGFPSTEASLGDPCRAYCVYVYVDLLSRDVTRMGVCA